jgi:hypothetical protein
MRRFVLVALTALITVAAVITIGCSSSSSPATVNLSLSDPATCGSPQGLYRHIYVTVTDVQINASATAADNDPGWIDLTPNLSNKPVQTDLLGVANQCFLATLGSTGLTPGSYQQLRVVLADDTATVSGNKCGSFANCLMLTSDPSNTPIDIKLSSESKTGIKIPSGQLAGGQFTVASGDNKDLNIDFNACASIVSQGNGQYRLKPVLHAGEVALQSTSTSISGSVVDSATGQAIVGGNVVVALEQNQNRVDRVVMETVTNSSGTFSFCPVAGGTYDVAFSAVDGVGTMYGPTVITGVQPGNALGTVPLTAAGAPATVAGQITTTTGSAAIAADLSLSALLPISGSNLMVTVPLAVQSASTVTLTTAANVSCPANTDCASYTMMLPASNPSVGAYTAAAAQTPAPPASGSVNYSVDGRAYVPGSAGVNDCNPSAAQTGMTVTPGANISATALTFAGCQ